MQQYYAEAVVEHYHRTISSESIMIIITRCRNCLYRELLLFVLLPPASVGQPLHSDSERMNVEYDYCYYYCDLRHANCARTSNRLFVCLMDCYLCGDKYGLKGRSQQNQIISILLFGHRLYRARKPFGC